MDQLVEVIKDVHNISTIPNQFYSYLQDIRNGTEMFGRIGKKKSKQGYSYLTIAATYEDAKVFNSIKWSMKEKDFKNTLGMLKYGKAIVMNHIDQVSKRLEYKKEREQEEKNEVIDQDLTFEVDESKYKSKDDDMDISKFL
ncbi:hypothetical protein [Halobacillus litoralis]|uniref:hypothetical protein n=1 Tax=Halobacillus litoralis TaxID=45668 RepID=UPI001CD5A95C|nr:hypothetical protein [Halobacillus litoralis]MCA1021502.1 hypothetical protein [Halobacillus litoralis]